MARLRHFQVLVLLGGILLLVASPAQAVSFTATYTFTGSPGNQPSEPVDSNPPGATFSDITRGPGVTPNAGLHSINSAAWTLATAPDPNDYYQFTIIPNAGFELDLTTMAFTERRSGTGIRTIDVRSSLDAFATSIFTTGVPDDTANRRHTVPFGPSFQDLTSPVTFRLFAYGAEAGAGSWRLGIALGEPGATLPANLQVPGDLQAVPEPSALVLLLVGLIGGVTAGYREASRDRATTWAALVVLLWLRRGMIDRELSTTRRPIRGSQGSWRGGARSHRG